MKLIEHFKVVILHKYYVMLACFQHGLYIQGILHDMSKFTYTEFAQSARYFQGTGTPIEKIKEELGYSTAWLHHKGHNKHHWQYWIDSYDGELKSCNIPEKYLTEMACDMIAASRTYLGNRFNKNEPLIYFIENRDKWLMTTENKNYVKGILEHYSNGD